MSTQTGQPETESMRCDAQSTKDGRKWKMRRRMTGLLMVLVSVLALGLVSPGTANAAVEQGLGKWCVGLQVVRCVWFNYDSTNGRVRAYGSVQDAPGGRQYSVKVNDIKLMYGHLEVGFFPLGVTGADNDGWHDVQDTGRSGLVSCETVRKYPDPTLYAQARFSWKGHRSGGHTLASLPVRRC